MTGFVEILKKAQALLNATRQVDWLAPLALRLYLAPVFFMAGSNKLMAFSDTVAWFGSPDGLNLPVPWLMASMAIAAELGGAIALVLGFAVRWFALPLMATMLVAIFLVHWDYGWLAIADAAGPFATERTGHAVQALGEAKSLLREHGDYDQLTQHGSLVMLNNGIEFAATYFVMLLSLLFTGAGRFVSLDYWIHRRFMNP